MSLWQGGREGDTRSRCCCIPTTPSASSDRSIGYKAPSKFHLFVKALFFCCPDFGRRPPRPLVISCRQRRRTCLPTPRTGTIKFWQFNFGAGCTTVFAGDSRTRFVCAVRIILSLAVHSATRDSPKFFCCGKVLDKNSR